ncbi:MAG: DUF1836 domain-containing protein [Clostridia bacterium]|nr:DUF1836 domain-containing protein [Clostridia bacterium]
MYDNRLIAAKLQHWEKYLERYRLPSWDDIPDIGLYMEQVVVVLKQYLDYLPPELKEEQFITAATINNYVRNKVMPMPIKKRYYRAHLAYLIMICSLKQGLSISLIQRLIPNNLPEDELKEIYAVYIARHRLATQYFKDQVLSAASPILGAAGESALASDRPEDMIAASAVIGGLSRLLAEKLLLLEGMQSEEDTDK